jgi:hypothetical protein
MSFAVGIGTGIGAGIAIGLAAGRSGALSAIEKACQETGATIHDPDGSELDTGIFLKEAVKIGDKSSRPKLIALLLVGIGALILGVVVFRLRTGV